MFFFKQKTAYEMRISDWSSDVCSSDLAGDLRRILGQEGVQLRLALARRMQPPLYPETLRQGLEAEAGRDDADRADDRGLVRQDLVGRTGQPVAAGRGDILDERDHRHVVFDQIGRASCRERVCQ